VLLNHLLGDPPTALTIRLLTQLRPQLRRPIKLKPQTRRKVPLTRRWLISPRSLPCIIQRRPIYPNPLTELIAAELLISVKPRPLARVLHEIFLERVSEQIPITVFHRSLI
jgi:hypothetical protein